MMGAQRAAPFRMWTLCVSKVGSVPGPPSEFHLRLPSPSVLPRHLLISPPPPPPSHLILVFLLLLRLPPGSLCFILLLIIIILLLLLILPPPTLPPPPLPFVSLAHGSRVPSRVNRGGIPRARGHEYYSPLSPDWHSSAGSSRPEPGLHCNPGRLRYHRYRRPPALSSLPRAPEAAFAWRHCAHFGTPLARFVAPLRAPVAAFAWRHCTQFGTPLTSFVAP